MTVSDTQKRSLLSSLAVYGERRIFVMLLLGFAAGLPNLLISNTLTVWLRDVNLSLQVISFFTLATIAYSFKFLWAPLIDRTNIPGLTGWLGHRRSWMLVAQAAIIAGLWAIAGGNPATNLGLVACFAVFTGFSSATQDIVIDAWRIEAAETEKQGAMAAAYQAGYRIAIIVAGAAPLFIAQRYGWNFSYGVMAALMLIGVAAVFAAPAEKSHVLRPIPTGDLPNQPLAEAAEWLLRFTILALGALFIGTGLSGNLLLLNTILSAIGADGIVTYLTSLKGGALVLWQLVFVAAGFAVIVVAAMRVPNLKTRPGVYLSHALGEPLSDFFRRFGSSAGLILALICFYRLSDFVLNINSAFYLDLGFTKDQIAEGQKLFGVIASMLGVFLGGAAILRLGLIRALVIGAFAMPISNMAFIWLATVGNDLPALFIAIGIDNVASGFAGTCLIAYMSSLTGVGFTATQYALFSSLYSLPGKLIASQSGNIVEGAARASENGGPFAFLQGLFSHVPPATFAAAMEKSHVAPAALGSGYVVFFLYSGLTGVIAVILALLLARKAAAGSGALPTR
jgi:PAT family beta-lactamase induction signal transducer AmpG